MRFFVKQDPQNKKKKRNSFANCRGPHSIRKYMKALHGGGNVEANEQV